MGIVKGVGPEIVFHLAAQPLVRRSYRDPLATWSTNVMGTAHVLEACRLTNSVRAIVVITTDKCYENREWPWGYREIDALGGHDPYSASKAGAERCEEVRQNATNVDWPCEVRTLFRSEKLGCKRAVSSAITWFFKNDEMGIILEDDCLPSQSFFWFCEELLNRYKDDMKIWHIGGCNLQDGIKRGEADYYFSKYNHIWGWASWASRWKIYDFKLRNINSVEFIRKICDSNKEASYWKKIFYGSSPKYLQMIK